MKLTFLKIINDAKVKYTPNADVVIFDILFSLSVRVKNKQQFIQYRHLPIDFKSRQFYQLLDDYFIKNRPLGHITKKARFYKMNFDIFSGILVPRPETELLCEKVIKILHTRSQLVNGVDLCCGSGNIAIAIKQHCPWVNLTAIDIQTLAIKNTIHNAQKHQLILKTVVGDFYQALIKHKYKFDFIVCNPPYVSLLEVDKTLFNFEHKINFSNSDNPLYFYQTLLMNWKKIINNPQQFLIAFEIGHNQKKALIELLKKTQLMPLAKFYKDYSRKDRILIIQNRKNVS